MLQPRTTLTVCGDGPAAEGTITVPTVHTNDIETYYERHGEGRPIVFVHGGWADHRMWRPQIDQLSDGHETIVYDVRGHGRTGPSAEERYTVELFAADLNALVTVLDLDRPVVCGLSLGGMIAQTYAARYDELRGLVLTITLAEAVLGLDRTIGRFGLRPVF